MKFIIVIIAIIIPLHFNTTFAFPDLPDIKHISAKGRVQDKKYNPNSKVVNTHKVSKQLKMYAYDAYFLDCAVGHKAPLLTLDQRLMAVAKKINVEIMEV